MGRDYLDLVEPATITIRANGHGEIAFGAMQAGLDLFAYHNGDEAILKAKHETSSTAC